MELETGAMLRDLLADADKAYKLPEGVKEDIASLRQSVEERLLAGLRMITVAEGPTVQFGGQVQIWARDAMGLLNDIEHAVDNFRARISASTGAHPPGDLKAFVGKIKVKRATAKARRQLATNIKDWKQRTRVLDERSFGSDTDLATFLGQANNNVRPKTVSALRARPELVGIDGRSDELVQILTEEGSTSNRQLKMVSILGVAGVGKTTLAQVVYERVKYHFDCVAWVSMCTQRDNIATFEVLLRQISQQDDHQAVPSHPNLILTRRNFETRGGNFETRKLCEVRAALKDKRYFIVFDNVWDIDAWRVMKDALIEESCGSAVLMTTRKVDIAYCAGGVYTLAPLSKIDSRKLFYTRLFHPEEKCPPISEILIEKCGGIPLCITTTADVLRIKPLTVKDWHAAHDSIDHKLLRGPFGMVLAHSLSGLPHALKRCLFYLSLFQKGYKISREHLVWGWIAEGFIKENQGITSEQLGENCLHELINRNLIEPLDVDAAGKVLSCRVHDLVHAFIISLSTEDNFATIVDGRQGRSFPHTVHRLSIQGSNVETCMPQVSHVRSLLVSGDANLMPSLSEFHELRVLDLRGCDSLQNDHLKDIGKLFYLKCLVLGSKRITHIPKEIGNLLFLQTLDLRETSVKELPESVVLLRQLKRLYVNSRTKLPDEIGKIEALEELGDISVSKYLLKELVNLIHLRAIRISMCSWDECYADLTLECLSSLFMGMPNVQSLSILTPCPLHSKDNLDAKQDHPSLQHLEIRHSTFLTLPGWICSLQNLSSLSIEVYKLSQDIINKLGELKKLLSLSLASKYAPEGKFGNDTCRFDSLTDFRYVSNAMGNMFAEGAMPILRRLEISFQASRTEETCKGFDFGLQNLCKLEHARVKIICFSATLRVVEDAEFAIRKAIFSGRSRRPNLEIERVWEDMVINEEEEDIRELRQEQQKKTKKKMSSSKKIGVTRKSSLKKKKRLSTQNSYVRAYELQKCLCTWYSLVEAAVPVQLVALDVELFPHQCGDDNIVVVEVLQLWELLEAYRLEAWELIRRITLTVVLF